MERIRIRQPRGSARGPCHEVLPPDPRDPDVVRAKALARAGDRVGRRTACRATPPAPRWPGSPHALYRLMEQYQQCDPVKFLIYAELAGAEIGPAGSQPGAC